MDNYRKQLKIDRYRLDSELIRQPQKYMDWALLAAKAEIETKETEQKYDLIKGSVEKKVRSDPERYGLKEKPTEAAVKHEALKNKKVKRYFKYYMDALQNEKILKRAEKAFQQRKGMLEALVQLNVQLHFAEPKLPQGQRESVDRAVSNDIKSQLKKKRKLDIKRRKKRGRRE